MKAFLIKRMRLSWKNSKTTHSYWLRKSEGWTFLLIALIFWLPISWQLLIDDWKLGISFLIFGFIAIYSGAIYRDQRVMGIIVVGVCLATVVPQFLSDAWVAFNYGDWISSTVLLGFAIYFWYWSGEMKKGRIPESSRTGRIGKRKKAAYKRYKR